MITAALFTLALVFSACEKPDASYVTSPSVLAILGTAEGEVAYFPDEAPPEPMADPAGWKFDLGNARFEELENFTPSIQVVSLLVSEESERMVMWIASEDETVWRWEEGPAEPYNGTLCFQLALLDEEEEVAVPLEQGEDYTLSIAFYNAEGEVIAAQQVNVAGRVSGDLAGKSLPGEESPIGRSMLACPRAPL